MNELFVGSISGLVVLLIGWVARTLFLSRRVYLVKPKLFDYTELVPAKGTKTIELTVINAGARAEEDIKVQLSPHFNYTILASNTSGLSVDIHGVLALARLAPKQDLTVVLVAEGGDFRKEHVMGISSKDVVGKVKESISDAKVTPAQSAFAFIVILVVIPLFSFFFGRFVEREIWPEIAPSFVSSRSVEYHLGDLEVNQGYSQASASKAYSKSFAVGDVTRAGDEVGVDVLLKNQTEKRLDFTLMTTTAVSEKRPSGVNYIEANVAVFPGSEKTIKMSDYLPKDSKPPIVMLEVGVSGSLGSSSYTQEIAVGK